MPPLLSQAVDSSPGAARVRPSDDGQAAIKERLASGSTYALLRNAASKGGENPLLGHRESPNAPYTFASYADVHRRIVQLATALVQRLGVVRGERVAVYGRNCPSWVLVQYAVNAAGAVLVPIYDTLGKDIVEYVCNHAEVAVVFMAQDKVANFSAARARCPTVRHAISFGFDAIDSLTGPGTLGELLVDSDTKLTLPRGEVNDINVIMYTSGTTGNPKGVVLTNHNILASVGSTLLGFERDGLPLTSNDAYLSYLPLSHIFEQQFQAMVICAGGRVGFYTGSIKLLVSDMKALEPTIFCGVPRVFARFQQRIEAAVAAGSPLRRRLFRTAFERQLIAVRNPRRVLRSALWDALVFRKIKAMLLPKVRTVITGSAPMSASTNDFLKVVFNCPVTQGYGLTESAGGCMCSTPTTKSGSVGGPLPGVQVRLADLPEMGYVTTNNPPQGEVCLRGPMIFKRYHNNAEATAKAIDADGWFHTGDVGQWACDGALQIIDRAKNLFKLQQGEYVSPEALENEYSKAPLVLQIFVYGNSLEASLVAVVVPDEQEALKWGKQHALTTLDEVVGSPLFKDEVLKQLLAIHSSVNFNSYERIRTVLIAELSERNELGQAFHAGNDLATPTFKLRRLQLRARYKEELEELYAAMRGSK